MVGVDMKLLQLLEFYGFNIYVNAVAVSNNIDVAPKCNLERSQRIYTNGRHGIFTFSRMWVNCYIIAVFLMTYCFLLLF